MNFRRPSEPGLFCDSVGSTLLRMTNSLNMQAFLQEFHHNHKRLFLLVNSPTFCDPAILFLSLFLLGHMSGQWEFYPALSWKPLLFTPFLQAFYPTSLKSN